MSGLLGCFFAGGRVFRRRGDAATGLLAVTGVDGGRRSLPIVRSFVLRRFSGAVCFWLALFAGDVYQCIRSGGSVIGSVAPLGHADETEGADILLSVESVAAAARKKREASSLGSSLDKTCQGRMPHLLLNVWRWWPWRFATSPWGECPHFFMSCCVACSLFWFAFCVLFCVRRRKKKRERCVGAPRSSLLIHGTPG